MKKTIIITFAMLIVFGGVVIFGASKVSDQWHTPQQDDVEISVVSPVEKMENEIKKYPYTAVDEYKLKQGAVSYQEAVYTASSALEYIYPDLDLQNQTAKINLADRGGLANGHYEAYYATPLYDKENILIDENVYLIFWFDPNGGKVSHIRRHDDLCSVDDTYRDAIDTKTETMLLERSILYAEKLGFENCIEYLLSTETLSAATDTKNYFAVLLRTDIGELIEFTYFNNKQNDYPLNIFSSYNAIFGERMYEDPYFIELIDDDISLLKPIQ